jgi:hypothetical protein
MSDPEGFLSRWSRRKRAQDASESAKTDAVPVDGVEDESARTLESDQKDKAGRQEMPAAEKAESAFDLSTLPSLDSITAETDIRPFLAAGVPPALTRAALRRVWVADPKIRDFIEIAENQWDFTAAGGAPGFDLSPPSGDIASMLKQIFPKDPVPRTAEEPVQPAEPPENVAQLSPPGDEQPVAESPPTVHASPMRLAQQDSNAASQKDDAAQRDASATPRRSHGRAMPR